MVDHFEKLARSQDRSATAKRIAALAVVFVGVALMTAAAAMAMAFLLAISA